MQLRTARDEKMTLKLGDVFSDDHDQPWRRDALPPDAEMVAQLS